MLVVVGLGLLVAGTGVVGDKKKESTNESL
jgi:LPXTG-motif cell wall-anchored protein